MKQKLIELIAKRKNCNLTQNEVAIRSSISTRQYRNIEAGKCKPNVETAISIAETFGVDVKGLKKLFIPQAVNRTPEKYSNTEVVDVFLKSNVV